MGKVSISSISRFKPFNKFDAVKKSSRLPDPEEEHTILGNFGYYLPLDKV